MSLKTSLCVRKYSNVVVEDMNFCSTPVENSSLFTNTNKEEMLEGDRIIREEIDEWLQKKKNEIPSITDGLQDGIITWFETSGHLLPKAVGLQSCDTLKMAIRCLKKNGVLRQETINYLKAYAETATPPILVWFILEDVYRYYKCLHDDNRRDGIHPLLRSSDQCVLQDDVISSILVHLGIKPLYLNTEHKEIIDDHSRNGELLLDLYNALTGESIQKKPTAVSRGKAAINTMYAITLLESKQFLDESFLECSEQIADGDRLVIQQVISNVIMSAVEKGVKIVVDGLKIGQLKKTNVVRTKVSDGLTLPRLITSLDSEFTSVRHIIDNPSSESERKWNIRKTIDFLQRKRYWPYTEKINCFELYNGSQKYLNMLYQGIIKLYPDNFRNPRAVNYLKLQLGCNT